MGLFVVGRLARRHQATVRLRATDPLTERPGVTASVHLPGTLIAPPSGIADSLDDPRLRSALESAGPLHQAGAPTGPQDRERPRRSDEESTCTSMTEAAAAAAEPTSGSEATGRKGGKLPKRSPGASGVNGVASPQDRHTRRGAGRRRRARRRSASPHRIRLRTSPLGRHPKSRLRHRHPHRPPHATRRLTPNMLRAISNPRSAPIFERMMSEWMMDPTTRESRAGVWSSAADDDWAAAAEAVERQPQRRTESGLPIRESGARLVPGQARRAPTPMLMRA